MPTLLASKTAVPLPNSSTIARPRLWELLNNTLSEGCRLTLVSAPAGSGKTMLMASWLAGAVCLDQTSPHVSWVRLDEADNDPASFWSYVVLALQNVDPTVGTQAMAYLQSPHRPAMEAVVAALINESALARRLKILVLDDFHIVSSQEVVKGLRFFLEQLPSNIRLAILTRSDPLLPLSRLRGRGQLVEVRYADLRFSIDESRKLLNESMGLGLRDLDVESLNHKTEGWAAALQIAGVLLRGRERAGEFIASFSGSNRYVLDYLTEEVLKQQPEGMQDFLLKTSVLRALSGPLCDAVLLRNVPGGFNDSQAVLQYLENENLFVVSLDDERKWYRYHQLFAELLVKRLQQYYPALEAQILLCASRWYEEQGQIREAVEYAISAHAYDRSANLLWGSAEALLNKGEYGWLLGTLGCLQDKGVSSHPGLRIVHATVLASVGRLQEAERCLERIDSAIEAVATGEIFSKHLLGRAAIARALIAVFRGDVIGSRQHISTACAKLDPRDTSPWLPHLLIANSHLSLANGELDAAVFTLSEAIKMGKAAGHSYMVLDAMCHLILARLMQGMVHEAEDLSREGLLFIEQKDLMRSAEAGMLLSARGLVLCELNRLEEAHENAVRGLSITESAGLTGAIAWSQFVLGNLLLARQDLSGAEGAAREALGLARDRSMPLWIESDSAALLASILRRSGRGSEARSLLQERGTTLDAEITYPRRAEFCELASILREEGNTEAGQQLLSRLEILEVPATPANTCSSTLSAREIQVLRLVSEGLSNKEIAQSLYVSVRTVKYHTTNIFAKLNTANRTQAISRARSLGLI